MRQLNGSFARRAMFHCLLSVLFLFGRFSYSAYLLLFLLLLLSSLPPRYVQASVSTCCYSTASRKAQHDDQMSWMAIHDSNFPPPTLLTPGYQ